VKVAGDPLVATAVRASTVWVPGVVPKVHRVCALPVEPVLAEAGLTLPPPLVTAKLTAWPATGFPNRSATLTTNDSARAVPAGADWLSPLTFTKESGGPATAVALKETVLLCALATTVWGEPATVPRVQVV
jgi:hypothetical protein